MAGGIRLIATNPVIMPAANCKAALTKGNGPLNLSAAGAPRIIRSAATEAMTKTRTKSFTICTNASETTKPGDFRFIAPVTCLPDILVRAGCQAQTTG